MSYAVSGEELISLLRKMVNSFMQRTYYDGKILKGTDSSNYNYERRAEEVGRHHGQLDAFQLITNIFHADVTATIKEVVGADQNEDNITRYAHMVAEKLSLKIDD